MNIKDLPQGSYTVEEPQTMNINDLPQGSYTSESPEDQFNQSQVGLAHSQSLMDKFFAPQPTGESPYQTGSFATSPVLPYEAGQSPLGVVAKAAVNTPTSIIRLANNLVNPQTYVGLGKIAAGGIQSIPGISDFYNHFSKGGETNPQLQSNRETFHDFVDTLEQQYGSWENIKRSIAEDPAGTALVVRGLMEGASGIANKAGFEKTATVLKKTGQTVFPVGKATEVIAKPVKSIGNMMSPDNLLAQEKAGWATPSETPKASYRKATEVYKAAISRKHDIGDTLVKNKIRLADNIEDGIYNTADTAENIRVDAGKMSKEVLRPSLEKADIVTPKTPVQNIIDDTIKDISDTKTLTPGDREAQISKARIEGDALMRKYPEGMSLTDMHDEKINYASNRYSPVGPKADTIAANTDRAFGRVLAKNVETKAPPDLPVHEFNAELQKQYEVADYLNELNNKKVPQGIGERIRKTTAKVVGAAVGHGIGGGILGGVGGYHIGGMLESMMENIPENFRAKALANLETTNPEVFTKVQNYLNNLDQSPVVAQPSNSMKKNVNIKPKLKRK